MSGRTWKQVLSKLRNMEREEFLFRGRQEVSKRADAVLARFGYDFARDFRSPRDRQRGVFFFHSGQTENLLRVIRERVPEQTGKIIEGANKICRHHFDLLGYENLNYGKEINWHLDGVHQKIAPRKPFYQIRFLDFSEAGDGKVTWELNRHQHFVTLAKAYRLTGDERYAREIVSQWRSWRAQDSYAIGINWASSLEVAFRSLSWIWMHALLDGTEFLTEDFETAYLHAQALNGRHIERYLSTYFSPNTHLLGEGVALFFLGMLCPELRGAERWKDAGWKIVLEQAEKQVNADGMHFEQSVYYHVYALDFLVHAALLASANGIELPTKLERTIDHMMNALYLLAREGSPPRFGDDDGGRLFDPARNRDEYLIDPLATGAILFQRGEYKKLCPSLTEEAIWLLGHEGVAAWDQIETKPAIMEPASLESSGIYMLASARTRSQLIVKSGPAVAQTRGHAHADLMSICLQSSGQMLLIDPGAYEYVGEGGKRNAYRGTAMHNTVTVDAQDQSEADGPFSWKQEIVAKTECWIGGETFSLLIGSHDGYMRLAEPVQHRRYVVATTDGAFLIRDVVEGIGRHRVEVSWRLSPDLQLQAGEVFRLKQSSQGLALLTVEKHGWSEEIYKGPWSPVYGTQRSTTVLKFGMTASMPAEFATLLVPLAETNERPGRLFRMSPEAKDVSAYRYETREDEQQFFFTKSGQSWTCGRLSSDAEFACITMRNNRPAQMAFSRGTYVSLDEKRLIETARVVDRCEMICGETIQVFCSDSHAITSSPASAKTIG